MTTVMIMIMMMIIMTLIECQVLPVYVHKDDVSVEVGQILLLQHDPGIIEHM